MDLITSPPLPIIDPASGPRKICVWSDSKTSVLELAPNGFEANSVPLHWNSKTNSSICTKRMSNMILNWTFCRWKSSFRVREQLQIHRYTRSKRWYFTEHTSVEIHNFLHNEKSYKFWCEPRAGFRIRIHFLRIRIRIQRIRMEANTDLDTDPDPDPIRIQGFNDQKLEKNNSWKKNYIFFLIKNCNLPIPRPP